MFMDFSSACTWAILVKQTNFVNLEKALAYTLAMQKHPVFSCLRFYGRQFSQADKEKIFSMLTSI